MKCSVVVPCLNESATLEKALGLAKSLIEKFDGDGEIIVADNGSTDGSQEIAIACGAKLVHASKKGYGFALLSGIAAAQGDAIVMGDADATYDFREAEPLVASVLNKKCDLAMGSRLRGKIEKGAMPFLHRYLGTPVLTFLIRIFFGIKISDCNCGMRAFSKEAFEKMHLVSGGMEFASEMLIKSAIVGLRVSETPISLYKDIRNREPHLHTWRDGWRHLRFILLMAPHVVFAIPGWFLTIFFGTMTLLLSLGPVMIASKIMDYHHLFYSVPLFAVGTQLLWFASFGARFRFFVGLSTGENLSSFPLERYLMYGGIQLLIGVIIFLCILIGWLNAGKPGLLAIRECSLALAFFLSGFLMIMNSLMVSMFELHIDSGKNE